MVYGLQLLGNAVEGSPSCTRRFSPFREAVDIFFFFWNILSLNFIILQAKQLSSSPGVLFFRVRDLDEHHQLNYS
jgi:hypothetical protein